MNPLNASPLVLRVLFWIVGVLYLIAGAFLIMFLPPSAGLNYVGGWAMALVGVATIWVGGILVQLLAKRSLIPDILLATMIAVRLFTDREGLFGSPAKTSALVGLGVAVVIVGYLWSQVRRLRGVAA